jgi:acetate---CoA ligase (ADP-forming)
LEPRSRMVEYSPAGFGMNAAASVHPSLEPLFRPKSVAIVGASPKTGSAGSNIILNLRHAEFAGEIYPVNPRYSEIHGIKSYGALRDIGRPVDAVFIAVAAQYAVDILRQAIEIGAKSALVNATGFADAGADGRARQAEMVSLAHRAGIPLCGPNNLGLVNLLDKVALWSSEHAASGSAGPVAVVSQSGSVALSLGEDPARLGLSYIITAGNEAVSGVGDYVFTLADDPRVKLILLFLETIRDPAGLAVSVRKARNAGQTVLAMKVGRSERARAAVSAHSGALSGEDRVVEAYFRQLGIIRARDLDDLVQIARLKLAPPPGRGAQPAYITLSGGQGAALADEAADAGLPVQDFPPSVVDRLRPFFQGGVAQNPCDAWGLGWDSEWFAKLLDQLIESPEIDPIVLMLDVPLSGHADGPMAVDMARIVAERPRGGKTILFVANSAISGVNQKLDAICREAGIPMLVGTGSALRAIAAWPEPPPASQLTPLRSQMTTAELEAALRREVRFVGASRANSPTEACAIAEQIGYPVALKGRAPKAIHKTELGLVKLGLAQSDQVAEAFASLQHTLQSQAEALGEGWIEVQPMVPAGLELLVAARRDPAFGPLVVVGAGGKLVELIADAALRLGSVDDDEAGRMLAETRIGALLAGYRDGVSFDAAAARSAISAVSRLMTVAPPDMKAIEINPLIVLPADQGAVAVDLVIE